MVKTAFRILGSTTAGWSTIRCRLLAAFLHSCVSCFPAIVFPCIQHLIDRPDHLWLQCQPGRQHDHAPGDFFRMLQIPARLRIQRLVGFHPGGSPARNICGHQYAVASSGRASHDPNRPTPWRGKSAPIGRGSTNLQMARLQSIHGRLRSQILSILSNPVIGTPFALLTRSLRSRRIAIDFAFALRPAKPDLGSALSYSVLFRSHGSAVYSPRFPFASICVHLRLNKAASAVFSRNSRVSQLGTIHVSGFRLKMAVCWMLDIDQGCRSPRAGPVSANLKMDHPSPATISKLEATGC